MTPDEMAARLADENTPPPASAEEREEVECYFCGLFVLPGENYYVVKLSNGRKIRAHDDIGGRRDTCIKRLKDALRAHAAPQEGPGGVVLTRDEVKQMRQALETGIYNCDLHACHARIAMGRALKLLAPGRDGEGRE